MCDTLVALPSATASGATLFAKNSDRPPDEVQHVRWFAPRIDDRATRATHIEVTAAIGPTHGCLLSVPYWCWGAEHGVNDVGVAIGAGTEVAVEAGDVVLVRSDPRDVPRIIALSRASYRKMQQNLWWAAGYNIVAIPLAAGVLATQGILLPPAFAAVLMSASTVIVAVNAQKTVGRVNRGIVNGAATYLPKPEYPQEAKDFCASGKVEIEVLIGENGNVIKAKAISGDELLRDVSVKAVKKAKFRFGYDGPLVKVKGIVVYNFPPVKNCIIAGVINKKAISIPKPDFPKSCRCAGIVKVEVIIDIFSGKVINARTISGNPLLRISAVKSAKKALFSPSMINSAPIFIKGLLIYNFSSSGEVKF